MLRPTLALLAVTTIALGCYKDDVRALGPDTRAVIVLEFDVGRSCVYNQHGDVALDFFAAIRALNRAARRNISGTVSHDTGAGAAGPVADATGSAWGGGPSNWVILTTGKTD